MTCALKFCPEGKNFIWNGFHQSLKFPWLIPKCRSKCLDLANFICPTEKKSLKSFFLKNKILKIEATIADSGRPLRKFSTLVKKICSNLYIFITINHCIIYRYFVITLSNLVFRTKSCMLCIQRVNPCNIKK